MTDRGTILLTEFLIEAGRSQEQITRAFELSDPDALLLVKALAEEAELQDRDLSLTFRSPEHLDVSCTPTGTIPADKVEDTMEVVAALRHFSDHLFG